MKTPLRTAAAPRSRLVSLVRDGRTVERALGVVLWLALFAILLGSFR